MTRFRHLCTTALAFLAAPVAAQVTVTPGAGPNGLPLCSQPFGTATTLQVLGDSWEAVDLDGMDNIVLGMAAATNCFVAVDTLDAADFAINAFPVPTYIHDNPPPAFTLDVRKQAKFDAIVQGYAHMLKPKLGRKNVKPSRVPRNYRREGARPLDTKRVAAFVEVTDLRTGIHAASATGVATSKDFRSRDIGGDRYGNLFGGLGRRFANAMGGAMNDVMLEVSGVDTGAPNNLAGSASHRVDAKDGGAALRARVPVIDVDPLTLAAEINTSNAVRRSRALARYSDARVRVPGYFRNLGEVTPNTGTGFMAGMNAAMFADTSMTYLMGLSPEPEGTRGAIYPSEMFICQLKRDIETMAPDTIAGSSKRLYGYSERVLDTLASFDPDTPVTVVGTLHNTSGGLFTILDCEIE